MENSSSKKWLKPGDRVLDVGTGSGILSIAALKLGAGHAFGTDIDEMAVETAKENRAVNGIPEADFEVIAGNILSEKTVQDAVGYDCCDLVVSNILAGVIMLAVAFGVAAFLREGSPAMLMNAMFALAGIGWATINVNSFPMVVELAKGGTVGKYTGYYYTASMAAQVLTPILSGFLMDSLGLKILFPYATVFVILAFVTMIFVKHGDNKPEMKKGLEALDVDD